MSHRRRAAHVARTLLSRDGPRDCQAADRVTLSQAMLTRSRSLLLALGLIAWSCDEASGPPDDLTLACQRTAECREDADQETCEEELSRQYDEAAGYGCSEEYYQLVSCTATADAPCASEGPGSCETAQDTFRRCQAEAGRDDCVVIGGVGGAGGAGPSGCVISCALFSAQCTPLATEEGGTDCVCESGASSGSHFAITSCESGELEFSARSACQ